MGVHAADKQAVSTGFIFEDMVPSAEHHTCAIIRTADCLTPTTNQKVQAAVVSSSPSRGSAPSVHAHDGSTSCSEFPERG